MGFQRRGGHEERQTEGEVVLLQCERQGASRRFVDIRKPAASALRLTKTNHLASCERLGREKDRRIYWREVLPQSLTVNHLRVAKPGRSQKVK